MKRLLMFVCLGAIAGVAMGQSDYPSRPVRVVSPFAPGGPTDLVARILAPDMGDMLKQPILVENRAGATGMIGQDFVSKAPPDGHTLVIISSAAANGYHLVNRTIDFAREFAMVGQIWNTTALVTVNHSVPEMAPIQTLTQLVAHARANPGKLNYTSTGVGSLGHLVMEKVKLQFGVNIEHVNYKGQGPAMQDVLIGRVPILSATFTQMSHVRAGKLRGIAVSTEKRTSAAPDIPTFVEQGVQLVGGGWVGMASSGGTPRPIVDRLANTLRTAMFKPENAARIFKTLGTEPEFLGPAEFTAYAQRDFQEWGRVIREAGIKSEP